MHDWSDQIAGLSGLAPGEKRDLLASTQVMQVPEGTVVFAPGMTADNLLLVLSGSVRVQQLSETGREIVLYRVHPGESCVMTTACLMSMRPYSAEAIAESDTTAVAIPRAAFDRLMAGSAAFRGFVFSVFSQRINELFLTIEEIAFGRIDLRLAHKLAELAGPDDTLHLTHAQLAAELGTAREVITRQLQEFQRRGLVTLSRGQVALRDKPGLQAMGRHDGLQ